MIMFFSIPLSIPLHTLHDPLNPPLLLEAVTGGRLEDLGAGEFGLNESFPGQRGSHGDVWQLSGYVMECKTRGSSQ